MNMVNSVVYQILRVNRVLEAIKLSEGTKIKEKIARWFLWCLEWMGFQLPLPPPPCNTTHLLYTKFFTLLLEI